MGKQELNGFVRFEKPSVSRYALRKSHAALYDVLAKKIDEGSVVTYEEAHSIWLNKACRNVVNGKPHSWVWRYDQKTKRYTSILEPMSDDLIKFTVLNWLTRTIGVLVMKGYLKVIPQVQLV
jgi:hypothetical protein